jgi:hypothetical protein
LCFRIWSIAARRYAERRVDLASSENSFDRQIGVRYVSPSAPTDKKISLGKENELMPIHYDEPNGYDTAAPAPHTMDHLLRIVVSRR